MAVAFNYTNRTIKVVSPVWAVWHINLNSKEFVGEISADDDLYKGVDLPNGLTGLRGMVLVLTAASIYDSSVRVRFRQKDNSDLGLLYDNDLLSVGFKGVLNHFDTCVMNESHFETVNNTKMGLEVDSGSSIEADEKAEFIVAVEWLSQTQCNGLFESLSKQIYDETDSY